MEKSANTDLAGAVERSLVDCGHMLHCTVEVGIHEGVVTLSGKVSSYYLKQMAQTAAMKHQSIEMLENDIEVVSTKSLREQSGDA